ncbi:hypothetical protein NYR54_01840, partial [Chelativorans sp. SCAU2101]
LEQPDPTGKTLVTAAILLHHAPGHHLALPFMDKRAFQPAVGPEARYSVLRHRLWSYLGPSIPTQNANFSSATMVSIQLPNLLTLASIEGR